MATSIAKRWSLLADAAPKMGRCAWTCSKSSSSPALDGPGTKCDASFFPQTVPEMRLWWLVDCPFFCLSLSFEDDASAGPGLLWAASKRISEPAFHTFRGRKISKSRTGEIRARWWRRL